MAACHYWLPGNCTDAFTLPEVRGSEEIWRTEQCIYQRYSLLQYIVSLHSVCIFSSLVEYLKQ